MTPLHIATSWNNSGRRSFVLSNTVDIVRLLIEHGADVSVQDKTQSTPLHLAAHSANSETVRLLLEHGADIAALDQIRRTPLHLASSWRRPSVRSVPIPREGQNRATIDRARGGRDSTR
ncbi:ankyrin repeat-containing domain protein [Lactarius pseudohatsudake]|nr:ankyrin repeat-containing domain protein [Lactarius pseudohatsudake]